MNSFTVQNHTALFNQFPIPHDFCDKSKRNFVAFRPSPPFLRRAPRIVCMAEPYLIAKLESAEKTWKELSVKLADPDVVSNPSEYQKLAQSMSELNEVVSIFKEFKDCEKQLEKSKAKEYSGDEEMTEMISLKINTLSDQLKDVEAKLKLLLLPSDPIDARNILLEENKKLAPNHFSSVDYINRVSVFHSNRNRRSVRVAANSVNTTSSPSPKARFVARLKDSLSVQQLQRPLIDYMRLPASQYSVLDAERIERIDDTTFKCFVYTFKFFSFEVCPVLLVRVHQEPAGCSINLLSCKLEGSPIVSAQNDKFKANMVNQISCATTDPNSSLQELTADALIEVTIDIPFVFRAIPVQQIESAGTQVLVQILKLMLPRFMAQLVKDYQAWATGDASRQPLGTGKI